MLDKNVDLLLVGKNHFSYMLGIDALSLGKKVLIVDDRRLTVGPWFASNLGDVERFFLKRFKLKKSFSPLVDIERFLLPCPLEFSIDRKRFFLGRSPSQNLTELFRKFNWADLKIPENFDEDFENYCAYFASKFLNDDSANKKDNFHELFSFLGEKLDYFMGVTPYVSEEKTAVEEVFFENFLQLMTARFQLRTQKSFLKITQRHLFLSFLSPRYQIDYENFLKELSFEFNRLGGVLEESSFKDWSVHKGPPWAIELESFQGLIYPKKTVLLGDTGHVYEVQMSGPLELFHSLEFSLLYKNEFKSSLIGKTVLFGPTRKIGTELPFFEARFSSTQIFIKAFYKHEDGLKASFLKKQIHAFVLEELFKDIISEYDESELSFSELEFGDELLLSSSELAYSKNFYPKIRHPDVKNVYHMGPSRIGVFGPFSAYLALDALARMH